MKKLFLMLAAAAAVASCSKDYTIVADQGEAIEFGSFVENSTRATSATDPSYKATTLAYFDVYGAVGGVNIFDGDRVERDGADLGAPWTMDSSAPKQYWIAGANYVFDAVVDATSVTIDSNTGLPTVLSYTTSTQTDMLYNRVTTTGKPQTNNGIVSFAFTHLLSKVKFSIKNTTDSNADNYRINVIEAKLINVYPSGDYAVPAGTWTPEAADEYVLEDLIVESATTEFHSKEVLLIPGSAVGVYVKAYVEATADGGTTWKNVSTIENTFENVLGMTDSTPNVLVANQAYHFNVSFGIGEEIKFTATALPTWQDEGDVDAELE